MLPLSNIIHDKAKNQLFYSRSGTIITPSPTASRSAARSQGFLENAEKVIRGVVAEFGYDFLRAEHRGVQIYPRKTVG